VSGKNKNGKLKVKLDENSYVQSFHGQFFGLRHNLRYQKNCVKIDAAENTATLQQLQQNRSLQV